MNNNEKKLLIFDYDGVIADSLEIIYKIMQNLTEKYQLPPVKIRDDVGKLLDKNFFESLSDLGFTKEQSQLFITDLKEQKIGYENELRLFPKIQELLYKVSALYNCVIITSTHEDAVTSFLTKEGITAYFSFILGGNSEPSKVKKIEKMLEHFSMNKKDVYFISDTTGDIQEGKEVGINTIGVTWGFHNEEKLQHANPDYLFTTVEELEKFLLHL